MEQTTRSRWGIRRGFRRALAAASVLALASGLLLAAGNAASANTREYDGIPLKFEDIYDLRATPIQANIAEYATVKLPHGTARGSRYLEAYGPASQWDQFSIAENGQAAVVTKQVARAEWRTKPYVWNNSADPVYGIYPREQLWGLYQIPGATVSVNYNNGWVDGVLRAGSVAVPMYRIINAGFDRPQETAKGDGILRCLTTWAPYRGPDVYGETCDVNGDPHSSQLWIRWPDGTGGEALVNVQSLMDKGYKIDATPRLTMVPSSVGAPLTEGSYLANQAKSSTSVQSFKFPWENQPLYYPNRVENVSEATPWPREYVSAYVVYWAFAHAMPGHMDAGCC